MNYFNSQKGRKVNKIIIALIIIVLILLLLKISCNRETVNINNGQEISSDYILDAFPVDEIPLLGLTRIQSMKYFVNYDEKSFFGYLKTNEEGVNYYNVVFNTSVNQKDFIDFYTNLMTEISDDYSSESQVYGIISNYRVSASHYGSGTAYLQVFLPNFSYDNPYFNNYPDELIQISEYLSEKENSYGLLNQNGGEIEYAKYFNLKENYTEELDKDNPYFDLYNRYITLLSNKNNYGSDPENMMIKWSENDYQITMTFMPSHERVYLIMRKLI